MKTILVAALVLVASLPASVAYAQQVEITAPAPPRDRAGEGIIAPGLQYEMTRPDDSSYYPPGPRVHYDPAFIGALSTETETPTTTGRVGFAGWTSPNTPVTSPQSGYRDVTGYFAFGFAVEWGGPPKRPLR